MLWFRRTLKPRHLVAMWIAYWLLLAGLTLPPAIAAILKATNAPEGQGNVGVSLGTGGLSLVVTVSGQTIYSASVGILALTLAVAGPPLLLFLFWLMRSRRPEPEREAVM